MVFKSKVKPGQKTKHCPNCNKQRYLHEFSIRNRDKGYLNAYCGKCMGERMTIWRTANKERFNEYHKEYYKNNRNWLLYCIHLRHKLSKQQ